MSFSNLDGGTIAFIVFFILFVGFFIYMTVNKGAQFGVRNAEKIGEVKGANTGLGIADRTIKVFLLGDASAPRKVGLQFVATTPGSYESFPITLSKSEARHLIYLLQTATN
jgi:hypothetical protein